MQADFLFAVNFCINGLCAVHTASEVIDMKKLEMALLLGMAGTILWNSWNGFTADWNHLQQNVLRMHILANSDSPADQALKLEVRDRLLASSEELFGEEIDFDHLEETVSGQLGRIEALAEEVLAENGASYSVSAQLVNMPFDARTYGELTMPAGNYDAIRVSIGAAKGQNWWCVMYPPLCLPAASDVVGDASAEEAYFSPGEQDMLDHPESYAVRFKCVEWWHAFKEWVQSES